MPLLRYIQSAFRQVSFLPGLLLIFLYAVLLGGSLIAAYLFRFDFVIPSSFIDRLYENLFWVVPFQIVVLFSFGEFGALPYYFRLPDVYRLFGGLFISAMILLGIWFLVEGEACPPRGVIISQFTIGFIAILGLRTGLRVYNERFQLNRSSVSQARQHHIAIVGAGDSGARIAAEYLSRPSAGVRPVVFLDDNPQKQGRYVHGIPIVDSTKNLDLVQKRYRIDAVVLALPRDHHQRIREITDQALALGLEVEIAPALMQTTAYHGRDLRLRKVEIEDLLGRHERDLDDAAIAALLKDKVVMITGAGGSIGGELSKQLAQSGAKELLLVDHAEIQLFNIERQLRQLDRPVPYRTLIADVGDEHRMRSLLESHRPQLIFHAAAHKHVPIMEEQPAEALKNNTLATARLARLATEYEVERFVLISTDKAIHPTSVMGASKRLAEIYLQALMKTAGNTRLMAVRFGNVLGSSGSVVPIFRSQIEAGGPITVTHPEVTRYFMTVGEAVGLVLQCATQGEGGEIFILDMGEPVKIVDLARQMIHLSGLEPEKDIQIVFTGLRPGEKLFEELSYNEEEHAPTAHNKIFCLRSHGATLDVVEQHFTELKAQLQSTPETIRGAIKTILPEYSGNERQSPAKQTPSLSSKA